ncbi:MAG: ureidoglycolate lyase [Blastocatellia bacterium]
MSAAAAVAYAPVRVRKISDSDKLIRTICLEVQPLTPEAFAPFGEIIRERGQIEVDLDGGQAGFVAQTVEKRPMEFDFLGRHRRTEQVFSPLGGTKSILAVAMPTEEDSPNENQMAAFLLDGSCAFKLHRGTWHTSVFPLEDRASFLIVDREGTLEEDYDLRDLKTVLGAVVEIRL